MDPNSDSMVLEDPDSIMGAKKIQAGIIKELLVTDEPCGQRAISLWKEWVKTTRRLKNERPYNTLDEYVAIRIWDAGVQSVPSSP